MVETTEPRYATLKAGLVRRVADGLAAQGDADATDQAVRLVAEFEDRVAVAAALRATSRDSEVREAIDPERLYAAILDELAELWGEPSDAVSTQVRPLVARSIASRYAILDRSSEPERVSDADYPVQIAPEYPEVER